MADEYHCVQSTVYPLQVNKKDELIAKLNAELQNVQDQCEERGQQVS